MADAAKQKNRQEIPESVKFLEEKAPSLFIFQQIGDKISGEVSTARMVNTIIDGVQKKDPAGNDKRHLQLLITDDESQQWVVDIQSENQKSAFRKAIENAGFTGIAFGDYFEMEYTHDDPPLRQGGKKELNLPRGYVCQIH